MSPKEPNSCPILGMSLASSEQFHVSNMTTEEARFVEATVASSTLTRYQNAFFAQDGIGKSLRISFHLSSTA